MCEVWEEKVIPLNERYQSEWNDEEFKARTRVGSTQTWNFQAYDHEIAYALMQDIREWLIETRYI